MRVRSNTLFSGAESMRVSPVHFVCACSQALPKFCLGSAAYGKYVYILAGDLWLINSHAHLQPTSSTLCQSFVWDHVRSHNISSQAFSASIFLLQERTCNPGTKANVDILDLQNTQGSLHVFTHAS